jgi:hypothetical protein
MDRALKSLVVPRLQSLQFTGSVPHFRRKVGAEHQLVMIQFNKYGGSFCLEVGRISQQAFEERQAVLAGSGKVLEVSDLTVGHCKWDQRARLSPGGLIAEVDHWFRFGIERGQAGSVREQPAEHFIQIAAEVAQLIDANVETFFSHGS